MPFTEDLGAFFEETDFAASAQITFESGANSRRISVIFDASTESVNLYDAKIEADTPQIMCRSIDLVGVRTKKDSISIGGKDYLIERIEPDGTGVSTAYLKKI